MEPTKTTLEQVNGLAEIAEYMDDEELTRDKVKRASTQILQAVDRKMRKPKKVKGKE